MRTVITLVSYSIFLFTIVACGANSSTVRQQPGEENTPLAVATSTIPVSETSPTRIIPTCADIDTNWGNNWPAVLETLEQLIAMDQTCGEEPLLNKKYAAHFNYASTLEQEGDLEAAIVQYQAALFIDPQRKEALKALLRLEALPKPTPPACLSPSPPRPDPAPAEPPDTTRFITVQDNQLQLEGQPFKVKGVNYYPRHAPWERFLVEANPSEMARELDLIKEAGFNTIRVFLWYRPLFTCQPEDAIPDEAAFALLDKLIQSAAERDLRLIITLNDLPDLVFRPLYTDWAHYDAQTVYIVRRYRNEPHILAWDVRNGADFDYGGDEARFSEGEVIAWLSHISQLIRDNDPYHLLTAGWAVDPAVTIPYVDILSVQYWSEVDQFQTELEAYESYSDKPLLLQAVGYHTWTDSPDEPQDELAQAENLQQVTGMVESQNWAGWIIWTAFDFVPGPGQSPTEEHFFGVWRVDLSPKLVLEGLP